MTYLGPGILPYWLRALVCGLTLLIVGAVGVPFALAGGSALVIGTVSMLLVLGGLLLAYGVWAWARSRSMGTGMGPESGQ